MSGISKIVDERIEKLRKEKIELDALRENLAQRELQIAQREAAVVDMPAPAVFVPPHVPRADADDSPKRKRGRPRKGESPNAHPEGSDIWRKAQSDMARLRAAQFADLAAIEEQKLRLLDEMFAERTEFLDSLAKLKLQKMTELEAYMEKYREDCIANIHADIERQRAFGRRRVEPPPVEMETDAEPAQAFVPPRPVMPMPFVPAQDETLPPLPKPEFPKPDFPQSADHLPVLSAPLLSPGETTTKIAPEIAPEDVYQLPPSGMMQLPIASDAPRRSRGRPSKAKPIDN
ncbi:MAG: hypothetical protein FWB88_11685 [Defluviitaleaceae bacterium]|nr:hypothetical protein [Defluviitaleaceae bacterium]MCL2239745.1 hypothetical protein [Defluviitaleaceae bacterium]